MTDSEKLDHLISEVAQIKTDVAVIGAKKHIEFMQLSTDIQGLTARVTQQNGRVARLEEWRSWIVGALAVIGFIILPVIGWFLIQIYNHIIHIQ